MENMKISCIKMHTKCFIRIVKLEGYWRPEEQIKMFRFNGEEAKKTYNEKWFSVSSVPEKVSRLKREWVNTRYEITNKKYVDENHPEKIPWCESGQYTESVLDAMYEKKSDLVEAWEDVKFEIDVVNVGTDIEPSEFSYAAYSNCGQKYNYFVTNESVEHQTLDTIIFPDLLLGERPGKISSRDMYNLTRAYVKEHIDKDMAVIEYDCDSFFGVAKKYPLYKPKRVSYIAGYGKRTRTLYRSEDCKTIPIMRMTTKDDHYSDYDVIPDVYGRNDSELKKKIDEWLEYVMSVINHPVNVCPCCQGVGYLDENKVSFLKGNLSD